MQVIFYTTSGCSLCERLFAEMLAASVARGVVVQQVDIIDDDDLLARYGERIPVLRVGEQEWDGHAEEGWQTFLTRVRSA
ncbi:MAG: glutaredoxin family protein [Pseudomonadota bacterium]